MRTLESAEWTRLSASAAPCRARGSQLSSRSTDTNRCREPRARHSAKTITECRDKTYRRNLGIEVLYFDTDGKIREVRYR